MEIPPLDTAAIGIQRGFDTMHGAAAKVASAGQIEGSEDRTLEAMVELKQGEHQAKASVKALSAENDVIGTLLSTRA